MIDRLVIAIFLAIVLFEMVTSVAISELFGPIAAADWSSVATTINSLQRE